MAKSKTKAEEVKKEVKEAIVEEVQIESGPKLRNPFDEPKAFTSEKEQLEVLIQKLIHEFLSDWNLGNPTVSLYLNADTFRDNEGKVSMKSLRPDLGITWIA